MKTITLSIFLTLCLAAAAFAQSQPQDAFKSLKALAGNWEGTMTTDPKVPDIDGTKTFVSLRVTSMGNVLMHEMTGEGREDDPITMLYLEKGRLLLTHYCDAGNRPRMAAKTSRDGRSVQFDFVDIAGGTHHGHMMRAKFTFIDAEHHSEDWTFMTPKGQAFRAHVELKRAK